jgi:hypothetical protein
MSFSIRDPAGSRRCELIEDVCGDPALGSGGAIRAVPVQHIASSLFSPMRSRVNSRDPNLKPVSRVTTEDFSRIAAG